MTSEPSQEEVLAAVRSIPHPRGHCCKDCHEKRGTTEKPGPVAQGKGA